MSRGTALTLAVALVAAAAASACVEDRYTCETDADCDLGEAGRCEVDQRCTAFDPSCPLHRRYADHSGSVSATCFNDHIAPANLCAAGQPPLPPEPPPPPPLSKSPPVPPAPCAATRPLTWISEPAIR